MPVLTANFEAGTQGNTIAAADPGSANAWDVVTVDANATAIYDNAQARGTRSGKIVTVTGSPCRGFCVWSTSLGTVTDHYGRVYLYPTNAWGTGFLVGATIGSFVGGYGDVGLALTGTMTVELRDAANVAQATTTSTIPLNTWSRIEYHFIHSATVGQLEVKLFLGANADGTTPDETKATAATLNTNTSANFLFFGMGSNLAGVTFYIDNILGGATSYPGPAVVPAPTNLPPARPVAIFQ